MEVDEIRVVSYEEWVAEGTRLFGADQMGWRFVCPSCGHVASIADWKKAGAPQGAVAFACIGRWTGATRTAFEDGSGPCTYSGGGLFRFNPVHIQRGSHKQAAFAFAEPQSLVLPDDLRALSLKQPMAWAISDYTKRIENRRWKPWKGISVVAIHASLQYHKAYADQIRRAFDVPVPSRRDLPRGAIVAVARIVGCIEAGAPGASDPWFGGPYGWVLTDVVKLDAPVLCRGSLGLWRVQRNDAALVRAQLDEQGATP